MAARRTGTARRGWQAWRRRVAIVAVTGSLHRIVIEGVEATVRLGYQRAGAIPEFAESPAGGFDATVLYYKRLAR